MYASTSARPKRKKRRKEIKAEDEDDSAMEADNCDNVGGTQQGSYNRNPSGSNQWGGVSPLDDSLRAAITDIHNRNIRNTEDILNELRQKNFKLGRTKLFEYKNAMNLTRARKTGMSDQDQTQIVLQELAKDPLQTRGPRRIWENLGLEGTHLPRDKVTQVMQDFHPEGFANRQPGKKVIHRTALRSVGPDEEWSMDGHDKLARVGFWIYGIRDKWTGRYLHYRVLPSNRYAAVIGIIFLECVVKYGVICVQGCTDRGSEIRDSRSIHAVLREMFAPELIAELIALWEEVPSPRNITIERSWRPLFETWGQNILAFYDAGTFGGTYQRGNAIHEQLQKWIWYPVVQASLDRFTRQQNNRRVRKQEKKVLPNGGTPEQFYANPDKYLGVDCGIPVDRTFVQRLLDDAKAESGHLMEYVLPEFDELAKRVYVHIGSPLMDEQSAWDVFEAMLPHVVRICSVDTA